MAAGMGEVEIAPGKLGGRRGLQRKNWLTNCCLATESLRSNFESFAGAIRSGGRVSVTLAALSSWSAGVRGGEGGSVRKGHGESR